MSDLTPFRKLSIAISGGGLAGATLANALVHQPHLEVNVYESAPEFSERGAAVGLAGNAQRSLQAIIPSAEELLNKAGAVSMNSTRVVIVSLTDGTLCCLSLLQSNTPSHQKLNTHCHKGLG